MAEEEVEGDGTTFLERNSSSLFLWFWALLMFIIDGIAFAVEPPDGDGDFEYGPLVFLIVLAIATVWTFYTINNTELIHKERLIELAEKKRLLEQMQKA